MDTERWGPYRVTKEPLPVKAGGNQGQIFLAIDERKNRDVVIKRRKDMKKAAFEAQVMKEYGDHPHLVRFFDFFMQDDYAHIVMERISGGQLTHKRRSTEQVVELMIQILTGLAHLHQCNYIHRDILPTNILVQKTIPNTVKIIDFGGAVKKEDGRAYPAEGEYRGRSIYKPPEKDPAYKGAMDDSWDLYSTACLGLYLLCRSPKKDSLWKLKNKKLQEVLQKALENDAMKRYRRAQDFIRALQTLL